jgi:NAD(P)H-dependent FMN reductase
MVLLATSPGSMGASSVLAAAVQSAPYFDGVVKASLSIPSFYDNFDSETKRLTHDELNEQLKDAISHLDYLK